MIRIFLRRLLLFLCLAGLPLLALLLILPLANVDPLLTNSISYDLKLDFLAQQQASHFDVLSIGSSINLNNLHSQTLVQALPAGASYCNLASFNANISNSWELLRVAVRRYRPQAVVMMSNHVDFESKKWQGLAPWQINTYLDQRLLPYFYLRRFNLYRLLQRQRRKQRMLGSARADQQQHMRMDKYGGVPLRVTKENLNPYRQDSPPITSIDSNQYLVLKEMAVWLKSQEIDFVYVQSPLKRSNCQSIECQPFQDRHIERCRQIIQTADQQFVDLYHTLVLADSVFCDEIHLHFEGPEQATQALTERMPVPSALQNREKK